MAKPAMYGMKRACVPNRAADQFRRNKAYFKGQSFVAGEDDRRERKLNKQLRKMKEEFNGNC